MRLILHIGMPKTGTSTLQTTLSAHASLLERAGILYPTAGGEISHNLLVGLLEPLENVPRVLSRGGTRDPDAVRARAHALWAELEQQIRASDAAVVVLSAEYLFGVSAERVAALRALLAGLGADVEVVAYLREPSSYYVSRMQQRVKASYDVVAPAEFRHRGRLGASRYLEAFDGRVRIRSAERSALHDGCVVRDFLTTLVPGGEAVAGDIPVTDVNVSMSGEAMCVLQALRRYAWPDENGRFAPESNHVIGVLEELRDRSPQSPARLRPELGEAVLRRHRDDLEWLRARFGVELSTVPLPGDGPREPPAGWTSPDLTEILDVEPDAVQTTLHLLLRELAARDLDERGRGRRSRRHRAHRAPRSPGRQPRTSS